MANGKCRGCELLEERIDSIKREHTVAWLDALEQAYVYFGEMKHLEAQLASEREKDTIARFEQYEAGNS